jgi:hypothetical protein
MSRNFGILSERLALIFKMSAANTNRGNYIVVVYLCAIFLR